MENKDFAVFILSHGRPNDVITYKTLKKYGYNGKIFIIIDNEDKTSKQYYNKYGKSVIMFDKKKIAAKTDQGDNFNDLRTTTHARNAIFEIAKKLNIKYFIQFDDDYTSIRYRFMNNKYITKGTVNNINKYFDILLNFYIENKQIKSLCIAQGGDFIGGESCGMISNYINMSRKAMNSFICSTDREFQFISRLNEDVNTYMSLGYKGELFLTVPHIAIEQKQTQATKGGMTETYIDNGTYQKSFFTVMYCPAFTKVALMGFKTQRLHHSIKWENAVPKIISESYRKTKKIKNKDLFGNFIK